MPGEGEVVTVTGHTPPWTWWIGQVTWQWWLLVEILVAAALVFLRVRIRRKRGAATEPAE